MGDLDARVQSAQSDMWEAEGRMRAGAAELRGIRLMASGLPHPQWNNRRGRAAPDSLAPPLVLAEQAINAQIVRALLREDDVFVEYDFAGVLRGDRLKEVQAIREAIGTALMTPNEARSTLNLPRSAEPGMDLFYLPANNMQPIGSTSEPSADPAPAGA